MRFRFTPAAVILIFFILSLTHPLRAADKKSNWNIGLDTGFNYFFGTVELLQFMFQSDIVHRSKKYEFSFNNMLWYGFSDDKRTVNHGSEGIKFDYLPLSTWSPFIFIEHEYDEFRKIRDRTKSGSGLKFTFIRNEKINISLSEAFLYEYENNRARGITKIVRSSERFKAEAKVNDAVSLFFILFHQPNFESFIDDYRIIERIWISVTLTNRLSLKFAFNFEYDNKPALGVRRKYGYQDTRLSIKF